MKVNDRSLGSDEAKSPPYSDVECNDIIVYAIKLILSVIRDYLHPW